MRHVMLNTVLRTEAVRRLDIKGDTDKLLRYGHVMGYASQCSLIYSLPDDVCMTVVKDWDMLTLVGLFVHSERGRLLAQRSLHEQLCTLFGELTGDVKFFLDAMTVTNTVLSGSNALRFADRTAQWIPSDFDFYTSKFGFDGFCFFLEHYLGALLTDHTEGSANSPIYGQDGAFIARNRYQLGQKNIDVMRSATPSPLYPLTQFHSTLVMNAISPQSLVIAYPAHIADRRGLLTMHSQRVSARTAAAKYESRGYQLMPWDCSDFAGEDLRDSSTCTNYRRYFGDEQCLTVPFSPCVNRVNEHGPIETHKWSAGWILGGRPCGDSLCENCAESFSYNALIVKDVDSTA